MTVTAFAGTPALKVPKPGKDLPPTKERGKQDKEQENIHQPYQKIIKDNKVSSNYDNFLRLYWLHEGLKNNLEIKETKTSKLKI